MEAASAKKDWRFYLSPRTAWLAIYKECASAHRTIKVEQYIFHNDVVGRKFLRLFIDKAKAGVEVRVLCDEVGSYSLTSSPLVERLRQSGGTFHFYNSPKWADILKPKQLFPRTHLKAIVVDGRVAFVGGVCIAARMKNWRDTQIRVVGEVVQQVEVALDGNSAAVLPPKRRRSLAPTEKHLDSDFSYIQNDPGFLRHPIYYSFLKNIHHAKSYIYISAAFFIPTRRLRRFLRLAVERGVEVIILIPAHSDFPIADWACLSYLPRMLKKGIRIHLYQPSVLHTKTMVVDGIWGTVGSCNMDPLSFFHNREANLIIKNETALREMADDFLHDLKSSRELTLESYKKIPLHRRVLFHFARLFRPIL